MMKCLNSEEANSLFSDTGFMVRLGGHSHGILGPREEDRSQRRSLLCQTKSDPITLIELLGAINRWLPSNAYRVLWINESIIFYPSFAAAIRSMRMGEGEHRDLDMAPGHLFSGHDYSEEDQTEISHSQAKDVGLLFALMSMIVIEQWTAVLVAEGSLDWIEFYEGNLVFTSEHSDRIDRAKEIASSFRLQIGAR